MSVINLFVLPLRIANIVIFKKYCPSSIHLRYRHNTQKKSCTYFRTNELGRAFEEAGLTVFVFVTFHVGHVPYYGIVIVYVLSLYY